MTKTITTTTVYCDICKKETKRSFARLYFKHPVKDYIGNECATYLLNYKDVCEECSKKIDNFLEEIIND